MNTISQQTRNLVDRSVLCWLATVDHVNHPNVSPKEIFCLGPKDRLLIADIASPGSVTNITSNAHVCVSIVDVFEQRGVKLIGEAKIISDEQSEFAEIVQPLADLAGPHFPISNVIIVDVQRIKPIIAPSYVFRPEERASEKRRSAYKTYGVRPRSEAVAGAGCPTLPNQQAQATTVLEKRNIETMFSAFTDTWAPKICGKVNGTHIKLAKFEGEFVWHSHANEDEMFFVIKGRLRMELKEQPDVIINPGEFLIVPKGVQHRPVAEVPCEVILVEPMQTINTGEVDSDRTRISLEMI